MPAPTTETLTETVGVRVESVGPEPLFGDDGSWARVLETSHAAGVRPDEHCVRRGR